MLSHQQKIERLRVGTEMSFNQANSLLNVLEGDDCTLEALTARVECLINCRDDHVRKHAKKALSDLTNLAVLLECFIGKCSNSSIFPLKPLFYIQISDSSFVFLRYIRDRNSA